MHFGALIWQSSVLQRATNPLSPAALPDRTVAYEVRGTARTAFLVYTNASGGGEQQALSIPWNKEFKVNRESRYSAYLSAQNQGDFGTVVARIYVNGDVLQQAKSSSPFGIASVSGVLDPDDSKITEAEISFNRMTPAEHLAEIGRLIPLQMWNKVLYHSHAIPTTLPGYAAMAAELDQEYNRFLNREFRERMATFLGARINRDGYRVAVSYQSDQLIIAGEPLTGKARSWVVALVQAGQRAVDCEMVFRSVRMGSAVYALDCKGK